MKKNFNHLVVLLMVIAPGMLGTGLQAQSTKTIMTKAGNMKLSGTSTLHDWTMEGCFQVEGSFKLADGTHTLQSLNGFKFSLPVYNLKSDKKKLDETAYKALKAEEHKEILFTMTSASVKHVQGNTYNVTALGNLTIAGYTKPITMNVNWIMNGDNTITCSGTQQLKMTDFQVKPPSFLGFMKTGDDIALDFTFQIKS